MTGEAGDPTGATTSVVTAFLRHEARVLLLRRSDAVETHVGRWGGVSGTLEGDPEAHVRREIEQETGLGSSDLELVRTGRALTVEDTVADRRWSVHPFCFESARSAISLSVEHDAAEWVHPTAILEPDRPTVPALWRAYERVAPSVRTVTADRDHGAATLSIRALEVLRDRAGLLEAEHRRDSESADESADATPADWDEIGALASDLREARPGMAVVRNRIDRAMARAVERRGEEIRTGQSDDHRVDPDEPPDPTVVHQAALATIERSLQADARAARVAAEHLEGTVATLSRSGTVERAVSRARPDRVLVATSAPTNEGIEMAERLARRFADTHTRVVVHPDGATAHVLATEAVDQVVVGADTVLPDGRLVNRAGTRGLATLARSEDVPVTAVASADKITPDPEPRLEAVPGSDVYDGDGAIDVLNPLFDVTPPEHLDRIASEMGLLDADDVREIAERHERHRAWLDRR